MGVRNFGVDLAMSDRPEIVAAITAACHSHFPELLSVHRAHKENDKLGVDYWLEFPNGKIETLDAKVRQDDYETRGDDRTACLELIANTRTKKPGWAVDQTKRTDWIMFFCAETRRSVFYNFRELRAAVVARLPALQANGEPSVQTTKSGAGSYQSQSLFVSHRDLWAAIYQNANRRVAA